MVSRPVCGLWWFLGGVVEEEGKIRRLVVKKLRRSGLTCWMIDRVTGAEVQCSEDAGEGEGAARGKGRGGGGGSAE